MARIQQEKALMSIASSMPSQFCPNVWQLQFMNSQPSPVPVQQFLQPQSSWKPSQQFSPVTGNPINPATTANLGNLTTTTRQFVKTSIKFRTSELEGIAVFRDYHANFRRVSHGVRD
jgi:hypothetical protein